MPGSNPSLDRPKTSLIAWAQVWLGTLVAVGFFAVLGLLLYFPPPAGLNSYIEIMLGALIAGFTTVMGFFLGSSTSGHSANQVVSQMASRSMSNQIIDTLPPGADVVTREVIRERVNADSNDVPAVPAPRAAGDRPGEAPFIGR